MESHRQARACSLLALLSALGGALGSGSLSEDSGGGLGSLLIVVLKELLESGHGHLIGGGLGFLSAGGGHGAGLLSSGGLLSLGLGGGSGLLGGSVFHDLVGGLAGSGSLGGRLLGLGGSLGGSLSGGTTLDLGSGGGGNDLLDGTTEGSDLGVSFLEGPLVTLLGNDTLGNVTLSSGEGSEISGVLGNGSLDLSVTEGLDSGLELVVSVEVSGPSDGVELFLELGLEGVDDKSHFEASVGGEGIGSLELKAPVGNEDNLGFEVADADVAELLLELGEGGGGEVGGDVEVGVTDEEVGLALLDEDLEHLLAHVLGEFVLVATSVDHVGEEFLEGRHFVLFWRDLN